MTPSGLIQITPLSEKSNMLSRRRFSGAALACVAGAGVNWRRAAFAEASALANLPESFGALEAESGGRLGIAVFDTRSGDVIGHRAEERFPMCSTFKLLAAAAVLAKADASKEQLTRRFAIEAKDILDYAPVTKQHVGADGMSLAELCEAAVTLSDNTAANLILASLGGPDAITQYARSLGDSMTRLDRIEPELNTADPGDPRDTTTPAAMARNVAELATGTVLSLPSREQLIAWLVGCKTGYAKLRAGFPNSWRVGDKTGAGAHGTSNDVAVIWPAGRPPLVVAAYLTGTMAAEEKRNMIHAGIGRAVSMAYGNGD
jgi:beta-lactamase class A